MACHIIIFERYCPINIGVPNNYSNYERQGLSSSARIDTHRRKATGRDGDHPTVTDYIRPPTANPPSSIRSTANLPSTPYRRASTSRQSTRTRIYTHRGTRPYAIDRARWRPSHCRRLVTDRRRRRRPRSTWLPVLTIASSPQSTVNLPSTPCCRTSMSCRSTR